MRAAPLLGEHTEEVLRGLVGLELEELQSLVQAGAIRGTRSDMENSDG
jgi:crotonobetainyl-CoA:carnitine CoA-transferase CaiB-like acyl-CoA transferase